MAEANPPPVEAHHLAIKPPIFSATSSVGWFNILEAQFVLKNITVSNTKFYHALSALPADVVSQLPDALIQAKDYASIKSAVIAFYEATKPELFEKLIRTTVMSGRPSANIRELSSLATKAGVGEELVRHKFIQTLPSSIAPVLAANKTMSLTELGSLADELLPLIKNSVMNVQDTTEEVELSNINQAAYTPKPKQPTYPSFPTHSPSSQQYQQSYPPQHYAPQSYPSQRYSLQTYSPRSSYPAHQSYQSSQRNNYNLSAGVRPFSPDQRPKVCRGHLYFGRKARHCKPWCQWLDKSGCEIQPNSRPASPSRHDHMSENQ